MTEHTVDTTIADNVRIVENFLFALQDEDFDAAAGALDENVVYQNVGLPTIRGRHKVRTKILAQRRDVISQPDKALVEVRNQLGVHDATLAAGSGRVKSVGLCTVEGS